MLSWFSAKAAKPAPPSGLPSEGLAYLVRRAQTCLGGNARRQPPCSLTLPGPCCGSPSTGREGGGGQEKGVDALGNEAIVWYFLREQMGTGK